MLNVAVHNLFHVNILDSYSELDENVVCVLLGKNIVAKSYLIVIQISSSFIFSDDASKAVNLEEVDYTEHVLTCLANSLRIDLRDKVLICFSLVHLNWNTFDDDLYTQNGVLSSHNSTVLVSIKLSCGHVLLKLCIKALSLKDSINEGLSFFLGSHEKFENFFAIRIVSEPQ